MNDTTNNHATVRRKVWMGILILVVVSIGSGGYVLYTQWNRIQQIDTLTRQIAGHTRQLRQLTVDLEKTSLQIQRQRDDFALLSDIQQQQNQKIIAISGHAAQTWKRQQIEQLLLQANRNLILYRDPIAAENLLKLADNLLAQLHDPILNPIRSALRTDMLTLQSFTPPDIDGIFTSLEALIGHIEHLPTHTSEHLAQQQQLRTSSPSASQNWFGERMDALVGLVRIRRLHSDPALIEPDQDVFLRQNLTLTLSNAQLSILAGHEKIFRQNIKEAKKWLSTYSLDSAQKDSFVAELDTLLKYTLDTPLVKIDRALSLIRTENKLANP